MNVFAWLIRLAFFAVVLWFALKNTTPVAVRLTETMRWDSVPLIVVMLVCIVIGVIAGALALAPKVFRLRNQLAQIESRVQARRGAPAPTTIMRGPATVSERMANAARSAGAVGQIDPDTRLRG